MRNVSGRSPLSADGVPVADTYPLGPCVSVKPPGRDRPPESCTGEQPQCASDQSARFCYSLDAVDLPSASSFGHMWQCLNILDL